MTDREKILEEVLRKWALPKKIKSGRSFITDLNLELLIGDAIDKTLASVREKVEEMVCKDECKVNEDYHNGWNSAIESLLSSLGAEDKEAKG